MSLSERLKKILATEEVEEEEEVEKAAKAADEKQSHNDEQATPKPKLVRKQITLGARPINVDLSKEVKRFNK